MKDMIIKGTGNSRFLRSVSNFKSLYPTYDDFVNALVAGNLPVDLNGINEAGIQQIGTALNKANLLPDSIPAALGLNMEDPQVKDALNVLANVGNLHVWERVQTYAEPVPEVPAGYTLGPVETDVVQYSGMYGSFSIWWNSSSSVTVSNDGTISLVSPNEQNATFSDLGKTLNKSIFSGKYIYITSSVRPAVDGVFFVPSDAKITVTTNYDLIFSKLQRVTGYPYTPAIPAGTTTDYLTSTDRDAYTEGTVDNTTITYLGQLGGGTRIEVGSYVGTGTYGSSNPNSLTFGFEPKMVIIFASDRSRNVKMIINKSVVCDILQSNNTASLTGFSSITKTEKTITWYQNGSSSATAVSQLNASGVAYYYFAIG